MKVSEGLNLQEEIQLIRLIGKLGARWTNKLYQAMAPRFALTAVETVFLTKINGTIHVLLHHRPKTDILVWAGRPASPGSMLRASDNPKSGFVGFGDAIARVKLELKGINFHCTNSPVTLFVHNTDRGPEVAVVFICLLENNQPPEGFWWQTASKLPSDILSHHPAIINAAIKHFKN